MASAQPPANAAPNTSAPIRIAALTTVMTLGQTIWRGAVEEGCGLMSEGPVVRTSAEQALARRAAISMKKPLWASSTATVPGAKKPLCVLYGSPENGRH